MGGGEVWIGDSDQVAHTCSSPARTGALTARAAYDIDLDDLALAEARRVGRSGLDVETAGVAAGRVRGDQTALAQVVRNLVDSAARHADQAMSVTVRERGHGVELIVEDDGPGIPEGQHQRIFERFVRLERGTRSPTQAGAGWDSRSSKENTSLPMGSVAALSSELGGARFVVRLPAPVTGRDADLLA